MIQLDVLGRIALGEPGRTGRELLEIVEQPRRLALLAYLAVAGGGRGQRRDRLVAVFWPEFPSDRARAALRRALWFLRARLGEGVLEGHGSETIRLSDRRFTSDVQAFRTALSTGDDARALARYQGPLLDAFFVPGAPEFEEWLAREREQLRSEAMAAALRLADSARREGKAGEADEWLRRALEITPSSEVALRHRLSLLARTGQRDEAIRAFERFAGQLQREYELEPAGETLRLVDAIRSGSAPRARSRQAGTPDGGDGPAERAWATMDRSAGQNRASIELFAEWLKEDESSAEAYAGLGAAHAHGVQLFGRARTELLDAMRATRLALALDEHLPQAHFASGLGLEFAGRLHDAETAYRTALRLGGGRQVAASQLGRTRMLAGDFAGALAWARRTSTSATDDPHVSLQVGLNLSCLGLSEEGDRQYEATLERWPRFPWAEASWAYMYLARGDLAEADRLCRRMLEVDPGFAAARLTAGVTAIHAGHEDEAVDVFQSLYQLDPDFRHGAILLSARSFLAYLMKQRGDRDVAERLLGEAERSNLAALAHGGSFGGIFYDQATIYAVRGDNDRALDWLEASLTAGMKQPDYAIRDPLLEGVRRDDRFHRWLGACRLDLQRQRERVAAVG